MEGEAISSEPSSQGKSPIVNLKGEKIEMEVKLVKRIYAKDLPAFQQTLTEWSEMWP